MSVPSGRAVPGPKQCPAISRCTPVRSMRPWRRRGRGSALRRAKSSTSGARGLKGRCRRGCGPLGSAALAIGDCRKQVHQTTPLQLTALPTDTVEVTDPTHPLYGLTFPLIGVTTKQRLGRVCVVWLYPGVERVIPLAATSLAGSALLPPSPCRLSVAGLEALLAVVASQAAPDQEEAHGDPLHVCRTHAAATVTPVPGSGGRTCRSAARPPALAPPIRLDESFPNDPGPGT